jgi:hypothetical protein
MLAAKKAWQDDLPGLCLLRSQSLTSSYLR